MDGFQKRREKKKEAICRSAFDLFSKYGVQKVTIEEIAKTANVSQVTIYNYFHSKDGLLQNVICMFANEIWEQYVDLLQSDLPFPEKIESIIFDKTKLAGDLNADFIRSFVSNNTEIEKFIDNLYQNQILPLLMDFFREGQEQGYVNPELSTKTILFYFNMFKEALNWPDLLGDESENAQLSKELTTMFFFGLSGRNSEKKGDSP